VISRVRGEILGVRGDRVHVMTAAGVAYEVTVPASAFAAVAETGASVDLHTALVVRDDGMQLFGFPTARERELFLRLQSASGVGPRLAVAILGALPARRIVGALRGREASVLQTVSGVGRKTAERMVLELADKLDDLATGDEETGAAGGTAAALDALRALGYSAAEAEAALAAARRAARGGAPEGTEELVRAALRHL
jgi:Holliday junction DNA helicase RuvA